MSYALEHRAECERLERQSELELYDYKSELRGLPVKEWTSILDAGCGSGVVRRYLATQHPKSHVVGCDFSGQRLEQAREAAHTIPNLDFEQQDLGKLTYFDGQFLILAVSRLCPTCEWIGSSYKSLLISWTCCTTCFIKKRKQGTRSSRQQLLASKLDPLLSVYGFMPLLEPSAENNRAQCPAPRVAGERVRCMQGRASILS